MSESHFEIYRRITGEYDWRLRAANGAIVATSGGQGFRDKPDVLRAITGLRNCMRPEMPIEVLPDILPEP